MVCPKCQSLRDQVIDSRLIEEGKVIRRRRECLGCHHRFTTYEELHPQKLRVSKKDGRVEDFDPSLIHAALEKACEKRPVSHEQLDRLVKEISRSLHELDEREVTSRQIGETIMNKLREEDEVAYVRYASVYRQFNVATDFVREVQNLHPVAS
ncbi:MAG: transcriptional regulator NrdR [Verrucomicrobiae bacterium]|nr:transcriptional regulator NrdR [Verrucomicrobiae bacterium]